MSKTIHELFRSVDILVLYISSVKNYIVALSLSENLDISGYFISTNTEFLDLNFNNSLLSCTLQNAIIIINCQAFSN